MREALILKLKTLTEGVEIHTNYSLLFKKENLKNQNGTLFLYSSFSSERKKLRKKNYYKCQFLHYSFETFSSHILITQQKSRMTFDSQFSRRYTRIAFINLANLSLPNKDVRDVFCLFAVQFFFAYKLLILFQERRTNKIFDHNL